MLAIINFDLQFDLGECSNVEGSDDNLTCVNFHVCCFVRQPYSY